MIEEKNMGKKSKLPASVRLSVEDLNVITHEGILGLSAGIRSMIADNEMLKLIVDNLEKKRKSLKMIEKPKEITLAQLEVVVMPNGEIICLGKTIGMYDTHKHFLKEKE